MSGGSALGGAVQDGDHVKTEDAREKRRSVGIDAVMPRLVARDDALIFLNPLGHLSLSQAKSEPCFFEVVSHTSNYALYA